MSSRADGLARLSPWIAVGAALLFFLHDRLGLGGNLPVLAGCAALAVAGTLIRWRDIVHAPADAALVIPRRAIVATAVLLPLSIAIAAFHAMLGGDAGVRSAIVAAVIPVLLGWSIFLFLPIARPIADGASAPRWVGHRAIVAGLVVATIVVLAASMRVANHWTSIDEVIYSLQARLFVQGDYRWHLDEAVQRFFTLPLMVPTPKGPYSQYPPGYPAILASFVVLGAPWVSGAVLGAVVVASTYMLGRRCASPVVGVIAAALLATHFLFLDYASRYLSHVAEMAAITSAAWLLFTPASASAKRRGIECLLAGLLIGIAVTIRPVTAIGLGLSIWLWLLSSRGWESARGTIWTLAIGMVVPGAALLLYNALTNGSPFRLGYSAAQGHLNDLGPGMRGLVLYDGHGQRVVSAERYAVVDAVRYEVRNVLWPLMRDLMPVFTILPVIAAAFAYRVPVRTATIAAFCTLPLAYFLYFDNGERFYLELLPFVAVGVAFILARIWDSDATAGRALAIFLVGAGIASSATTALEAARDRVQRPSDGVVVMRELLAFPRTNDSMLVFVRNPPLAEPLFIALSPLNFGP
ncbi:MAG: hypothetical protein JF589_08810, partial [Gemmatimonadetes bacterium]|nr:hypothetical protein [Gemmatimonadota bacterium]